MTSYDSMENAAIVHADLVNALAYYKFTTHDLSAGSDFEGALQMPFENMFGDYKSSVRNGFFDGVLLSIFKTGDDYISGFYLRNNPGKMPMEEEIQRMKEFVSAYAVFDEYLEKKLLPHGFVPKLIISPLENLEGKLQVMLGGRKNLEEINALVACYTALPNGKYFSKLFRRYDQIDLSERPEDDPEEPEGEKAKLIPVKPRGSKGAAAALEYGEPETIYSIGRRIKS